MQVSNLLATTVIFFRSAHAWLQATPANCNILKIKLNPTDVQDIQVILDQTSTLPPISTDKLLTSLKSIENEPNKEEYPYFWPFLCFLESVEGAYDVTYDDLDPPPSSTEA